VVWAPIGLVITEGYSSHGFKTWPTSGRRLRMWCFCGTKRSRNRCSQCRNWSGSGNSRNSVYVTLRPVPTSMTNTYPKSSSARTLNSFRFNIKHQFIIDLVILKWNLMNFMSEYRVLDYFYVYFTLSFYNFCVVPQMSAPVDYDFYLLMSSPNGFKDLNTLILTVRYQLYLQTNNGFNWRLFLI